MNEERPHRTLAEWSLPRTVIRGPYAEGESEQDRKLREEREEDARTATLVWRVMWTMLGLIVLYVVGWMIFK